MSNERVVPANERHQQLHADISAVLKRYADEMTAEEILAITATIVGQTIALQDEKTMSSDRAMKIVIANIQAGNAMAVTTALMDRMKPL